MISSHRTMPIVILCIFIGYSVNMSLGKEMGVDEESSKNYIEKRVFSRSSHKFFYALFSVTLSFLLGFY